MHFCKDNKQYNEKLSFCLSLEEFKNTINILESIIQYIRNVEKSLKEIMNQNNELEDKFYKEKGLFPTNFEQNNKIIQNIYSKGNNHIEEIENIINKFRKFVLGESCRCSHEDGEENYNENFENKFKIDNEAEEIKNYFEGKISIMDKKIKVFEILESLYIKQIAELKNNLNKFANNRLKKINGDLLI